MAFERMAMRHSSISSEESLTWSDTSSTTESDLIKTPPQTPRHSEFTFHSPPQDQEDIEMEATDAFSSLDLASNPFVSPTKSTKTAHISKWASELSHPSPTSELPMSPFKSSNNKAKKPSLRMDLSTIPTFEYGGTFSAPSTAQLINAPRIGCEPSPSPTTMTFPPMTPRPSLVSRFSDESSSSSSSGADTPPIQSPVGLLPSPAKLALPNLMNTQAMTPRTVDALDCFGISSSATSCLMSRGRSKDKLSQSPQARLLPRSPLSMPPSNFGPSSSFPPNEPMRSPMARFASTVNPYFLSATSS